MRLQAVQLCTGDARNGRQGLGVSAHGWRWCTDAGEPTVLLLPGPWCQMARMETGFATRIMRLSTSVAIAASPRWAGKMRACSVGPMIALERPTAVSARL